MGSSRRHAVFMPLLLIPLALSCAHQAVVASDPPGAEVFVNGEKVGVTPLAIEDPPGWSRDYEITLRKEGYESHQVTLTQDVWNPAALTAAGICGLCTCGLAAIYFLPRSRHLEDRYAYALKRKTPLPPVEEGPTQPPQAPSTGGPGEPAANPGDPPPQPAPPGNVVPQSARVRQGHTAAPAMAY